LSLLDGNGDKMGVQDATDPEESPNRSYLDLVKVYCESDFVKLRDCQPSSLCKELPAIYPRNLALRNCDLTNKWAPTTKEGVEILYIGESAPASGEFIYNVASPLLWFAGKIQKDLSGRLSMPEFKEIIDKEDLLTKMQNKGVLALDCCKCAVNYDTLSRDLRNRIVCNCCGKHTRDVLTAIVETYRPKIRFAFPHRRGARVLNFLASHYGSIADIR
jgi:hypothetical protein